MRAITVRQPWAWAIIHGGKDVENRTRNIAGTYRGPVAIHAAVLDATGPAAAKVAESWRRWWTSAGNPGGQRGHIIGVANLVDAHRDCTELVEGFGHTPTCSAWAMSDHWHLCLAEATPLPEPIPYRGRLGLWTLPDDIEAAIREQATP